MSCYYLRRTVVLEPFSKVLRVPDATAGIEDPIEPILAGGANEV